MGGVDLADMLVALYRTGFRSHRWYISIFSQVLDICINNAWLLYRRDVSHVDEEEKPMASKQFRYNIAEGFFLRRKKRGRPTATEIPEPKKNRFRRPGNHCQVKIFERIRLDIFQYLSKKEDVGTVQKDKLVSSAINVQLDYA
ncbi:hypothetical protein JTB14_036959 [Gonioctena quinquepunctata]|nr:hypothetical protein JTB14_036959 [Gonioctena quinquepunctata]